MKRKKYPRLPNGFGELRYLGKNRANCFAVHPPATERDEHGRYIRPKALCYVDDWYVGFAVLNAYHAGTYKPGDELAFKSYRALSERDLDTFCNRLLTDYTAHTHVEESVKGTEKTFSDIYDMYYDSKYGDHAPKKLSEQSARSTQAAYKNLACLHDKVFRDLRLNDLQACLDNCPLKSSSIDNMKSLITQMYRFAEPRELCDKNYGQYLQMPDVGDHEHGIPFSDDELVTLWKHKDDPTVEMILIMCYSGYRVAAYTTMEVNVDDWYFRGGVKTKAGKDRIVPIHTAVRPLVTARVKRDGALLNISTGAFRNRMDEALNALGMERHTPHDCRHTFSRLCEKYGVNEADRKRLMGHSFGGDITNGVYGHRTVEELRAEIEKIKAPDLWGSCVD